MQSAGGNERPTDGAGESLPAGILHQLNTFLERQELFTTKQQNKILLITNISNYISFPPQIAYKLIEAGRSKDILQIKSLSIDGLNNERLEQRIVAFEEQSQRGREKVSRRLPKALTVSISVF